jgi:hypothetical protein
MTDDLTLENFHARTGFRFRVSNEQKARVKAGTLTREQAFEEFLASGGVAKLKPRKPEIPDSVYLEDGLTTDNFSERVKAATGVARRFRMSREQCQRHANGLLTREQALQEVIASKKAAQTTGN